MLGLLLAPGNGAGLGVPAWALVVGEELRVDQTIAMVLVKVAVEPLHRLLDTRALLNVLGVGG